jgi:hypothetical protein
VTFDVVLVVGVIIDVAVVVVVVMTLNSKY